MASKFYCFMLLFFTVSVITVTKADTVPRNAAGVDGQPLQLNCTYDGDGSKREVQWRYYRIGGSSSVAIYQYGEVQAGYRDDYTASSSELDDNIIVNSLVSDSAGKYACSTVDPGDIINREIQVASASSLSCTTRDGSTTLEEGSSPELICSAAVSSNPQLVPRFQWFRGGEQIEGSFKQAETTTSPNELMYTYNFTVSNHDDGVPFECRLSFEYVGTPDDNDDDSNPTFEQSCTIELEVLFGATDVEIFPKESANGFVTLAVGEQLHCAARGSGELQYDWFEPLNEIYRAGQNLTAEESWIGSGTLNFNCTVTNKIGQQDFQDTAGVNLFVVPPGGEAGTTVATFGLTIIMAILSITFH